MSSWNRKTTQPFFEGCKRGNERTKTALNANHVLTSQLHRTLRGCVWPTVQFSCKPDSIRTILLLHDFLLIMQGTVDFGSESVPLGRSQRLDGAPLTALTARPRKQRAKVLTRNGTAFGSNLGFSVSPEDSYKCYYQLIDNSLCTFEPH